MDRFAHVPDVSKYPSQTMILAIPFTPQALPRMHRLASSFQRIRYRKLEFVVEPQISSACSGGYVTAFVRDAVDTPTGSAGIDMLTAQVGSKTTKWWESSVVPTGALPDLYYTETSGLEPRWSSPGVFCLAVDGKASMEAPVTIFCRYQVELSAPTAEAATEASLAPVNVKQSLYMKEGADNLVGADKEGSAKKLIPGAEEGDVFVMRSPRCFGVSSKVDQRFLSEVVSFHQILVKSDTLTPAFEDGKVIADKSCVGSRVLILPFGETIQRKHKAENLCGSQYLCLNQRRENWDVST